MIDMILPLKVLRGTHALDSFCLGFGASVVLMWELWRGRGGERKRAGGIVGELAANVPSSSRPTCQLDR
jgi:hypothetical protein